MKLSRRRYRQIGTQITRNRFPDLQLSGSRRRNRDESNQSNSQGFADEFEREMSVPENLPNALDITNDSDDINQNIRDSADEDEETPEDAFSLLDITRESPTNSNDPIDQDIETNDDFGEDEWHSNTVRDFCLRWRLRTRCVRELLSIFHLFGHDNVLPKSSEALMRTPLSEIHLKDVEPGHYHHIGLTTIVKHLPSKVEINGDTTFRVVFHIDGISFANASSVQGWTILGKLVDVPDLRPFLIGVYVGEGTPKDFDVLLEDLSNDLVQGRTDGYQLNNGTLIHFQHVYTICDSPARSKVLYFFFLFHCIVFKFIFLYLL